MSKKDIGIPIFFPWTKNKYSHALGNLCELISQIWELRPNPAFLGGCSNRMQVETVLILFITNNL